MKVRPARVEGRRYGSLGTDLEREGRVDVEEGDLAIVRYHLRTSH
jgi:hypothetical protein